MVFKVIPTQSAKADIHDIVNYIAQDSTRAAEKWFSGFWDLTKKLEEFPFRFALISEIESPSNSYRSCLYHSHRIIYRVDETSKTVYIVRVYHSAREPLTQDDF